VAEVCVAEGGGTLVGPGTGAAEIDGKVKTTGKPRLNGCGKTWLSPGTPCWYEFHELGGYMGNVD
jgi:hypothetical protein